MSDGFDALIDDALAFFRELAANNSKDWFDPRKDDYVSRIRKPAEFMADLVAEDLSRLSGVSFKPKVFRIYRDVRFSKDKTPYNAHLHVSWFPGGDGPRAGWFLGAAPEYLFLGAGAPGPQGPALTRLRAALDRDGDAFVDAMDRAADGVGAKLHAFGAPPLKRVPKPFAPDHPHAELLKRKGIVLGADLPDGWRDDGLTSTLRRLAKGLEPARAWLDSALTA
ncbi:MAG: DUF2461 domain-containing protein [Pseudomonadota bacterium]